MVSVKNGSRKHFVCSISDAGFSPARILTQLHLRNNRLRWGSEPTLSDFCSLSRNARLFDLIFVLVNLRVQGYLLQLSFLKKFALRLIY